MKKHILTLLLFAPIIGMAQTTKPDTIHYKFQEPDVILIDNLIGQFDVLASNSDKVSTAQYTAIHHAVLRVDSLIKVQYFFYHKPKEQPKTEKK